MAKLIKSLENRCNNLLDLVGKILYESNPNRKGWELHEMKTFSEFTLKDTLFITNNYNLYECYKSHLVEAEIMGALWDIEDGFALWVDTFKSGRTSIDKMLNVYTVENLEKMLNEYEPIAKKAWTIRENWINENKA